MRKIFTQVFMLSIVTWLFVPRPEYFFLSNNFSKVSLCDYSDMTEWKETVDTLENDEMEIPKIEPESGQFLNSIQSFKLSGQCL